MREEKGNSIHSNKAKLWCQHLSWSASSTVPKYHRPINWHYSQQCRLSSRMNSSRPVRMEKSNQQAYNNPSCTTIIFLPIHFHFTWLNRLAFSSCPPPNATNPFHFNPTIVLEERYNISFCANQFKEGTISAYNIFQLIVVIVVDEQSCPHHHPSHYHSHHHYNTSSSQLSGN